MAHGTYLFMVWAHRSADSVFGAASSPVMRNGAFLWFESEEKARAEADGIIKNAERQIQLETARALEQIRNEAADLSVAIASKLIQKNLTREDNERLIQDAMKQLQ